MRRTSRIFFQSMLTAMHTDDFPSTGTRLISIKKRHETLEWPLNGYGYKTEHYSILRRAIWRHVLGQTHTHARMHARKQLTHTNTHTHTNTAYGWCPTSWPYQYNIIVHIMLLFTCQEVMVSAPPKLLLTTLSDVSDQLPISWSVTSPSSVFTGGKLDSR